MTHPIDSSLGDDGQSLPGSDHNESRSSSSWLMRSLAETTKRALR
jgi:hypothetical protein